MKTDIILLDHGGGGKIAYRLITDMMLPTFDNPILKQLDDGAICQIENIKELKTFDRNLLAAFGKIS